MSSVRIAVICLGLLLTSGVRAEVRAYDVGFKYQREVYEALSQVLIGNPSAPGGAYGRVQMLPTGQILIDARPDTHAQIEQLLADVTARQAEVPPRAMFRYWILLGSGAAESGGDSTPGMLSDVLDELEGVHGDLMFRVLGTASLVTESGQEGMVEGTPLAVTQRAHVQGDTASASIRARLLVLEQLPDGERFSTDQQLELDVTLERGEFLVLGENTIDTPGGIEGTVFYIVHWPAGG